MFQALGMCLQTAKENVHDDWTAEIRLNLPLKVEFDSCNDLPGAQNHQLVKRPSGQTFLKTCCFMFKECVGRYGVDTTVQEEDLYICD